MPNDTSDKRERIMRAALELFAERGFHGTAVPPIAERAGVGAGTIYRYFQSKEGLVNELFQHWKKKLSFALLDRVSKGRTFRERFHLMWSALFEMAQQEPEVLKFMEMHHHGSYLDDASCALEEKMLEPALAMVKAAQEQAILKPLNANLMMSMVFGAFLGVVSGAMKGQYEISDEVVAESEDCLWEAVRR